MGGTEQEMYYGEKLGDLFWLYSKTSGKAIFRTE